MRPSSKNLRNFAAILALAVGTVPYFLRATEPAALRWADDAGLVRLAALVRTSRHAARTLVHAPAWLLGSLSDAAWAFALGAFLSDAPPAVLTVGFALAIGHELGQGAGLFSGTFDPIDLVVLSISYAAALAAFRRPPRIPNPATSSEGSPV